MASNTLVKNELNTVFQKRFMFLSAILSYPARYLVWPHRRANHPVGPRA